MKSRKHYLFIILSLWCLLFAAVFFSSHSLIKSGLTELEQKLALDSGRRVMNSFRNRLSDYMLLNKNSASNSLLFSYLSAQRDTIPYSLFIYLDLFLDHHIREVIVIDNQYNIVLSKKLSSSKDRLSDLTKKEQKEILTILATQHKNLFIKRHGSIGFFYQTSNKKINFLVASPVITPLSLGKIGTLVYVHAIDETFFQSLAKQISYPVKWQSSAELATLPVNTNTLKDSNDNFKIEFKSNQAMHLIRRIKDVKRQVIGGVELVLSRDLYLRSQQSMLYYFLIIALYSTFGFVSMMVIVTLFFRKQESYILSFARFVPQAFLKLLNKASILDIHLGNHVEKHLTVLFLDIRNFTTLSEGMSSKENFDFINQFLMHIAPVISKHNGFIDKFIGDGIMALFSGETPGQDRQNLLKTSRL